MRADQYPGAGASACNRNRAPYGAPEMEIEAAASLGAPNDESTTETARWYLPEGMFRHGADRSSEDWCIMPCVATPWSQR